MSGLLLFGTGSGLSSPEVRLPKRVVILSSSALAISRGIRVGDSVGICSRGWNWGCALQWALSGEGERDDGTLACLRSRSISSWVGLRARAMRPENLGWALW